LVQPTASKSSLGACGFYVSAVHGQHYENGSVSESIRVDGRRISAVAQGGCLKSPALTWRVRKTSALHRVLCFRLSVLGPEKPVAVSFRPLIRACTWTEKALRFARQHVKAQCGEEPINMWLCEWPLRSPAWRSNNNNNNNILHICGQVFESLAARSEP
jgi:hypothetical protein